MLIISFLVAILENILTKVVDKDNKIKSDSNGRIDERDKILIKFKNIRKLSKTKKFCKN